MTYKIILDRDSSSIDYESDSSSQKTSLWKKIKIFFSHFLKIIGSITRLTKRRGQNLTENPQKGSLLRFPPLE